MSAKFFARVFKWLYGIRGPNVYRARRLISFTVIKLLHDYFIKQRKFNVLLIKFCYKFMKFFVLSYLCTSSFATETELSYLYNVCVYGAISNYTVCV